MEIIPKSKKQRVREIFEELENLHKTPGKRLPGYGIALIRELEVILKTSFRDALDMKQKVGIFLADEKKTRVSLPVRIRRARRRANLTQEQLAIKVSKSQTYIQLVEKGERVPSGELYEWLVQNE